MPDCAKMCSEIPCLGPTTKHQFSPSSNSNVSNINNIKNQQQNYKTNSNNWS